MKAYVISLPTSEERRSFQRMQLTRLGLEHVIVDAVGVEQLVDIEPGIRLDGWERPFMPTEVACFFSHYNLWKLIASSDQPALILEDDALLSIQVPDYLRQIQSHQAIDHLSLETRLRKKLLGPTQTLKHRLGLARLYQDRTGAAAYILWPTGARKLIAHANAHGAALADAFISNLYALNSWQAVPALSVQSDIAKQYGIISALQTHSYIQANDKRANYKAAGQDARMFKLRRVLSQLKLALRFLRHIVHAQRKQVGVEAQTFSLHP
jgi:glycosyl transferase family 25